MSRTVRHRWVLTGMLVAQSAVHVGGIGEGPATSLGTARDGQDRPLLPGTSLAGAIRAALGALDPAEERLWGRISGRLPRGGDDGTGEASWVWVADATAPADTVPEVRESVSIDRIHGVAARGHLFTREVLPIGTRFSFQLRVDDPEPAGHDGPPSAAERLVRRIADLLRGPSFTLGAATTRGLGRVRLDEAGLHRYCLHDRAGMIATLRGTGTEITLSEPDTGAFPARLLRVRVPWRPHGPLMVQLAVEGEVVDAVPLTARTPDAVRLLLPGSSIKGALRSHAERIVRTARDVTAPEPLLDQLKATGQEPVGILFGTAGEQQTQRGDGRRGALTARECLGGVELSAELWAGLRLPRYPVADPPTGTDDRNGAQQAARQRAELTRLQNAVTELNAKVAGMWFTITPHNAVDRWTGGAADSLLFATLEPHTQDPQAWAPIVLEIDTGRLGDQFPTALALLLFLLRDLCDGLIPFGHGTTRGMGAVRVDPAEVTVEAGAAVPLRAELHGRSLAELLGDTELTGQLERAWAAADEAAEAVADETAEAVADETAEVSAVPGPAQESPRPVPEVRRPVPVAPRSVPESPRPVPEALRIAALCTAREALSAFAAAGMGLDTVGFAYRSSAAPWFRLDTDGTPRDAQGGPVELTGVFELRAFDAHRELRWWHIDGGRGQARELTDQTIEVSGARLWSTYQRLLWGAVSTATPGWATLSEARIGSLQVPVPTPPPSGAQVWLEAVEYVTEDDHGNVSVVDERLTGLVVKGSAQ